MQAEQKESPVKEWRPSFWWLFGILVILCIFRCYIVTFPNGDGEIVETGGSWFLGWLAIVHFCSYRWGRTLCIVGANIAGPGLVVLLSLVVTAYSYLLFDAPRPRPMFHNNFIFESHILQYWSPSDPVFGAPGQVAWADHRDNQLIVILTGEGDNSPSPLAKFGLFQSTIQINSQNSKEYVINKAYDSLLVIRADGQENRFPLGKGLAKEYRDKYGYSDDKEDLLQAAGELLTPEEKKRFDQFIDNVSPNLSTTKSL